MAEFLLELFSEDIPARMQLRAAKDLGRLLTDRLGTAGLAFDSSTVFSSPRRIGLSVLGLPMRQPDTREERRGPRVGAPEAAISGFLRSVGLDTVDQCDQRNTGKGVFWVAVIERRGRETPELLAELTVQTLLAMPWPKSMRWADGAFRWVRPLHNILAVFDGKALPGGLSLGCQRTNLAPSLLGSTDQQRNKRHVAFSSKTYGHRFLGPEAQTVSGIDDYVAKLLGAGVIIDREQRRARIWSEARSQADAYGLRVAEDPELLEEVTGLVEWPVVLMGTIDDSFMVLPPEVLTTSMRTHQKYFALTKPDGRLAARFIAVANMVPKDPKAVIAGNERVLRARLSDAAFFWNQDRKHPLRSRLGALRAIVFHARLGTVFDKVTRLESLAGDISGQVPGAEEKLARHAAILSKTDLVTGMVGEFPELQGIIGRYYALEAGEPASVADALADHYRPQGPGDQCPTRPVSIVLALADKVDTMVGFFAIGEKPTGSRDPYALRRAALGIIRLIVENGLRVDLESVFYNAYGLYRIEGLKPAPSVRTDLLDFIADRLKVVLRDQGVRHDLIDAVFALGRDGDLNRVLHRVAALQDFLATDDGANLLTAYRRATNIVRIEEKRDDRQYRTKAEPDLLAQDQEQVLLTALRTVGPRATELLTREQFTDCMSELARLRAPVDAFFDHVTVNVDQPAVRANRLALLQEISATLHRVADFSKIEG